LLVQTADKNKLIRRPKAKRRFKINQALARFMSKLAPQKIPRGKINKATFQIKADFTSYCFTDAKRFEDEVIATQR
jgi:hypothetical protein